MELVLKQGTTRLTRRVAGNLGAALWGLPLDSVRDPREGKRKWSVSTVLRGILAGMAAGAKGLGEVELLTAMLGDGSRRLLKLPRRMPDTTARDLLMRLDVQDLRHINHMWFQRAERKKQIRHTLPLRCVSMDGKHTASWLFDRADAPVKFGQRQKDKTIVRTITSCLMSADGRPCLDAFPIPPETNEMGVFQAAAGALLENYPGRFDVIMYDAGACGLENASWLRERGLDYVFCLTSNQPTLKEEATRLFSTETKQQGPVETRLEGSYVVERRLFLKQLVSEDGLAGFLDWTHLQTMVRVEVTRTDKGTKDVTIENHEYITSLAPDALTSTQWIEMLRRRWSVENENHNTWDRILREDTRPWILAPAGMINIIVLRRIVYNILCIYRAVTLRSETSRATPWTMLLKLVERSLLVASTEMLSGIRRRSPATL